MIVSCASCSTLLSATPGLFQVLDLLAVQAQQKPLSKAESGRLQVLPGLLNEYLPCGGGAQGPATVKQMNSVQVWAHPLLALLGKPSQLECDCPAISPQAVQLLHFKASMLQHSTDVITRQQTQHTLQAKGKCIGSHSKQQSPARHQSQDMPPGAACPAAISRRYVDSYRGHASMLQQSGGSQSLQQMQHPSQMECR